MDVIDCGCGHLRQNTFGKEYSQPEEVKVSISVYKTVGINGGAEKQCLYNFAPLGF